jgi:hypothetical protein
LAVGSLQRHHVAERRWKPVKHLQQHFVWKTVEAVPRRRCRWSVFSVVELVVGQVW